MTTAQVDAFDNVVVAMQDRAGWRAVVDRFGIRRTSPKFRSMSDALHDALIQQNATEAGRPDLSR